jgi:serine/threonine-protein kinase RsbW
MVDFATNIIAEPEAISALTERVSGFLADSAVDSRAVHHVALVLDELLTNVAMHGGASNQASASVKITVSADRVTAEIVDAGAMFDPCREPSVDLSLGIKERAIGGLGLLLVHRVTEGFEYQRVGDRNRTIFWVKRAPAGQ